MQKKYLYFLAAAHLCNDINSGALPAVLPFLVIAYGFDYTAVAGLVFASSFLSAFIQPLFGYLADRYPCHWFMGLGVLIASLSLAATGFLTDYWALFAAVTCMGIGSAVFHPEAARMVNLISDAHRGASMSIFSVGGNAGFGFGPLLAVILIGGISLPAAIAPASGPALFSGFGLGGLAAFGALGLIMGLALFVLAPRIVSQAEKNALAKATVKARGFGQGTSGNNRPPQNNWPAFRRLTLVITARSIVISSLSAFLPLYCINHLGASAAAGSSTLSALSLLGIAATLVGGRLADGWGYVSVIKRTSFLLVTLLVILTLVPSVGYVYLLLLPLSLAIQGAYSSFVVLGQTYLAKNIGLASGVTMGLSFSLGGIVVPGLGYFADSFGIAAVMVLTAAVAAACALGSCLLPKATSR